ncbi:MAG: hypothetical protein ACI8TF_000068 [Paracoccaceae bacterium]|jgi:hypothetical protein
MQALCDGIGKIVKNLSCPTDANGHVIGKLPLLDLAYDNFARSEGLDHCKSPNATAIRSTASMIVARGAPMLKRIKLSPPFPKVCP